MAKIHELQFILINHPPYSPDLALSDFILFPNYKFWHGGQRFLSNKDMIESTDAYFAEQDANCYLKGIKQLEHRSTQGIDLKGDYFEK